MKKTKISLVIFLALIVRLGVFYFQYSGDLKNHLVWGNGFLENPLGFFDRHFTGFNDPNYPPLAIMLFAFSNWLFNVTNILLSTLNRSLQVFPSFLIPLFQSENMMYAFLKIPSIFADILIGYFIYTKTQKLLLSIFFLFNPASIYLSSVWGQIEPVTSLFLITSLVFSNNIYLSVILFVLGSLSKQTILWFSPLMLVLWYKNFPFVTILKSIVLGTIMFFSSFIPFGYFPKRALEFYLQTLTGSSNVVSDAAWNMWHFVYGKNISDSTLLFSNSIRFWSLLIIFLGFLITVIKIKKTNQQFFVWSILVFFVQTRVHERHLAYAIPLFLLSFPISYARGILSFTLLSAYHLLNLTWSLKLPFIK